MLKDKKVKQKTCRICKVKHTPTRAISPTCNKYECMVTYAQAAANKAAIARKKKEARQHKEKLEAIKPKADYLKEAQREFNKFIRLRDFNLGCVSCDKQSTWQGQWHASHYRSVGSAPHLRFDERNVHKSCSVCNNHLSSNAIEYRKRLIIRYGVDYVEEIEADQTPKHYTIDDIKQIKINYKKLIKTLKESN